MKYCSKCGSELKAGTTFCGVCGSQISLDVIQRNDLGTESSIPYKKNRSTKKIGAIIIAAIIFLGSAAGGGYYYYQYNKSVELEAQRAAEAEAFANTPEGKAQLQLAANGISGKVVATTYTTNNVCFLALIDNGSTKSIAAYDAKNNLYIAVEDPQKIFDILNTTSKKYNSIIFTMDIKNAPHGNDDKFGEWNGTSHKLPVFVSYHTNNRAEIEVGMINSGVGLHPKQFNSYLQETVNVDLTVLIMTNVKALKSNMDTKKITL